jgi:hypothetical protein
MKHHNQIMRQGIAIQAARSSQRSIIEKVAGGGDTFPWTKCQFMCRSAGANVTVNAGSVIKLQYTPLAVASASVAIAESDTWVGIQVSRDLAGATIIALSSEPVTDDDYVRFWFAVYKKISGTAVLQKLNLGQIMNVDISAYGD